MNLTINGIPDVPHETPAGVDCGQCGHALTVGDRLPGNANHLRCPVCDGLCDEGLLLADWFDAAVAAAPRTMHPHASDLRGTSMIATASVHGRARLAAKAAGAAQRAENRAMGDADYFEDDDDEPLGPVNRDVQGALLEMQAIQRDRIHLKDAAREAAHGYSVADELREVGPEPSDACPYCLGDGWRPDKLGGHFWVECDCQGVS